MLYDTGTMCLSELLGEVDDSSSLGRSGASSSTASLDGGDREDLAGPPDLDWFESYRLPAEGLMTGYEAVEEESSLDAFPVLAEVEACTPETHTSHPQSSSSAEFTESAVDFADYNSNSLPTSPRHQLLGPNIRGASRECTMSCWLARALLSAEYKALPLAALFELFEDTNPKSTSGRHWRQSMRHALISSPLFVRCLTPNPRSDFLVLNEAGSWWAVAPWLDSSCRDSLFARGPSHRCPPVNPCKNVASGPLSSTGYSNAIIRLPRKSAALVQNLSAPGKAKAPKRKIRSLNAMEVAGSKSLTKPISLWSEPMSMPVSRFIPMPKTPAATAPLLMTNMLVDHEEVV